jgi:hypothetical protein
MVSSRQATAQVAANLKLCRDHYRLVLGLSAFTPQADARQYQAQESRGRRQQ